MSKLIFMLLISSVVAQYKEGDGCFNNRYKTKGACIFIDNCKKVIDDVNERDLSPQVCQDNEERMVICCPGIEPTTVTATGYRDSKIMCAKYAESVYELREGPTPSAPPTNVSICAHKAEPLIVGGKKAKAAEFPHMALIGFDDAVPDSKIAWLCGGTLISEEWVLTAAHCLDSVDYGPAKHVRLGELDYKRTSDKTETQDFTIVQRISKRRPNDTTQYDDIGLVKINSKANFNKYVRPACLYTRSEINAKKAIATGWGYTEDDGSASSHLLRVTLKLQHNSKCNSVYSREYRFPKGINETTQICCGGRRGKDTCQGDSGGPLQIYADQDFYCMYYVIGVTSTGLSCTGISPAIFTRVSAYVNWIDKIVWNSN